MGVLFKIFPQTPTSHSSLHAEIVELSTPADQIGSGPSDDRMYVINPVAKGIEYGMHEDEQGNPYVYLPPWDGPIYEPAHPDADGNFLHYDDIDDPKFRAAHTYACIRYTLDVWEGYFERRIDWYFKDHYSKAEVVVLPEFENAQIGRGFIEIGTDVSKVDGSLSPFTLNFDVIAHEVGHGILFSIVGEPGFEKETGEFLGFQESSGDVISMIAALHFDSVVDEILDSTSGNLYMANHLNRFAEISELGQIRMACNNAKLSDFSSGWRDSHMLGQPLTGALFDILVDIFHEELVSAGAMSTSLEQLSDMLEGTSDYEDQLQDDFAVAYGKSPMIFRTALVYARDALATLLVDTWSQLSPDYLHYIDIHKAMKEADQLNFNGKYNGIIDVNFEWRDIGTAVVGPQKPKIKGLKNKYEDPLNEGKKTVDTAYGHNDSDTLTIASPCSHTRRREDNEVENRTANGNSASQTEAVLMRKTVMPKSYAQRYCEARLGDEFSDYNTHHE